MKIIIFILLFFFSCSNQLFSQDTLSAKFFPLNVGNIWVYRVETFPPLQNPIRTYSITKDTIISGHKYFFYKSDYSDNWMRYDSLKGNLIFYSSTGNCSDYTHDKIMDSLSSGIGNIIVCQDLATYTRKCTNIYSNQIFNVERQVKRFEHDGLVLQYFDYALNIGIVWTASGDPPPANNYEILKGCVVNGIVYGDTTLTDVHQVNSAVPDNYSLSQNYPNPFNPNTIINYSIPSNVKSERSNVKLMIYNNLGMEVKTLVNEYQNAGSYSVEFNGEGLPSGVYYYRIAIHSDKLSAGDFTETKRMILLK